jgi:hypothetical protein
MNERDFYTESPVKKKASYTCPRCRESAEFQVGWLRRSRKKALPPGVSDLDRTKFAKARDYLVRVDDFLSCPNPRCRHRFEIPDDHTVAYL